MKSPTVPLSLENEAIVGAPGAVVSTVTARTLETALVWPRPSLAVAEKLWVASVSAPEPQQLLIKPFDAAALKDIEKAIRSSDLGLAPDNDGKVIRLKIPAMSGDQRTKMAKKVKELAENAKVSCRNVRRDSNKHVETEEKAKTMSEDDAKKAKDKIQDVLKQYEVKADEVAAAKTKEILE